MAIGLITLCPITTQAVVRALVIFATVAPTVIDDADDGYQRGQRWIDTVASHTYTLVDPTPGAAVWVQEDGGGGGGGGTWGSITGTLSAQTDLQAALDAKQDASAELDALAALASNGWARRTGVGAWTIDAAIPWASLSGVPSSFTPATHAASHAAAGSDPVTVASTQVTGLAYFATGTDAANLTGTVAAARIAAGSLALSKLADQADATFLGNNAGSAGPPLALTVAQAKTLLAIAAGDVSGLGSAATKNIGSSAGTVCAGDDSRLSDARTPSTHAASHRSGGSDAIKLDELAAPTDVTTLNVSTTAHGLTPKAPNDATKFLDGTGAWSVPAGGSASDMFSTLLNAEVAVTGAVTATIGKLHKITGTSANYTITLPAVSGNTGKLIGFYVGEYAIANKVYTIDGNASEKIDNSLTIGLCWKNTLILYCDGSNWRTLHAQWDNDFQNLGAWSVQAVTTNPTKATSPDVDKMFLKRVGRDTFHLNGEYYQASGSGGANGSGTYKFTLPFGLSFNDALMNSAPDALTSRYGSILGSCFASNGTTTGLGVCSFQSGTQFTMVVEDPTAITRVANGSYGLASKTNWEVDMIIPVKGWS